MLHRVVVRNPARPTAQATRPAVARVLAVVARLARLARLVSLASALVFAVALAGCGRKATREDCEAVVDRNVELQLKALGVTDPATVAKRRDEMRGSMKDDIDKCVGKRVTDAMMACVKSAETADKIDKCLR
jgi:hypothetical protein